MQYSSLSDFLAMGGYGFYVWLSFGSCALILGTTFIVSKLAHKNILDSIEKQQQREIRIKKAKQESLV